LSGAFVDSVAEVAERVGDKLELAIPLSGISEEDVKNKKQLKKKNERSMRKTKRRRSI
jgi:hypothetical protein